MTKTIEDMPTLATITAAEIAAMPADSVALRVLCAEAMGWSIDIKYIDAHPDKAHLVRFVDPHGILRVDSGGFHEHWKKLAERLPNPANNPADAFAAREWLRGKDCMVKIYEDGAFKWKAENRFYSCYVESNANKNILGWGATEHHATALALAKYGRRAAQGEIE